MKKTKRASKGGRAIKLSHEVINTLKRKQKKNESFDSIIRRILGLPSRDGKDQSLKTFYVITKPEGAAFNKLEEARGEAMIRAAMKKKRKAEKPIKVKEYV